MTNWEETHINATPKSHPNLVVTTRNYNNRTKKSLVNSSIMMYESKIKELHELYSNGKLITPQYNIRVITYRREINRLKNL